MTGGTRRCAVLAAALVVFRGGLAAQEERTAALYRQAIEQKDKQNFSLAIGLFRQVVESEGAKDAAQSQYWIGYCYFYLKDYKKSANEFKTFLRDYRTPGFIGSAYYWQGRCFFEEKNYTEAIERFRRVTEGEEKSDDLDAALFYGGLSYLAMEPPRLDLAVVEFARVVQEYGAGKYADEARFQLGYINFLEKEYAAAVKTFSLVPAEAPEELQIRVYYWTGECHLRLNEYERADAMFQKIVANFPSSSYVPIALYKQGLVRVGQKEYVRAEEKFREVVKKYPSSPYVADSKYRLALAVKSQGRFEEAITALRELAGDTNFRYRDKVDLYIGECYVEMGRYDEALEVYRRIAATGDADGKARAAIRSADIQAKKGDPEGALATYRAVARRYPQADIFEEATYKVGRTLYELERYEEAAGEFETLLRRSPNTPYAAEIIFFMGEADRVRGRYDDALKRYRQVEREYGGALGERALEAVGFVYYKKGEYTRAIEVYRDFVRLYPKSEYRSYVHYYEGLCFLNIRDLPESEKLAREQFALIVNEFPKSKFYEEALYRIGLLDFQRRRFDDAVLYLTRYLKEFPSGRGSFAEAALFWRSNSLYEQRQYGEAKAGFEEVARAYRDGKFACEALFKAASCAVNVRDFAGARDLFAAVAGGKCGDLSAEALFRSASVALQEKDVAGARTYAEDLKARFPRSPLLVEALYKMGEYYYGRGEYIDAQDFFKRAALSGIASDLADDAYYWRGWSLFRLKQYGPAASSFEELVRAFPKSPLAADSLLRAGKCHAAGGDYEKAARALLRLMTEYPEDPSAAEARIERARVLAKMDRGDDALKELGGIDKSSAQYHERLLEEGKILMERGDFDGASARFKTIFDETADEPAAEATYLLGRIREEKKDYAEAMRQFQVVLHVFGEFAEYQPAALYHLGYCLYQERQAAKAEEILNSVVRDYPRGEWAKKANELLAEMNK